MSDPAVEPLTVSGVKTYLRIDHSDEDTLISEMIAAVRMVAEDQINKSLITQSWKVVYDDNTPSLVDLPHGPVQSITSVKVVAEDAGETTINAATYHVNALGDLVFESTPSGHRIVIEYVAGYGDAVSDVPTDIRHSLLMHVAQLYEFRDTTVAPPMAAQLIYNHYREVRL